MLLFAPPSYSSSSTPPQNQTALDRRAALCGCLERVLSMHLALPDCGFEPQDGLPRALTLAPPAFAAVRRCQAQAFAFTGDLQTVR